MTLKWSAVGEARNTLNALSSIVFYLKDNYNSAIPL
jgi:hypothetical protein